MYTSGWEEQYCSSNLALLSHGISSKLFNFFCQNSDILQKEKNHMFCLICRSYLLIFVCVYIRESESRCKL